MLWLLLWGIRLHSLLLGSIRLCVPLLLWMGRIQLSIPLWLLHVHLHLWLRRLLDIVRVIHLRCILLRLWLVRLRLSLSLRCIARSSLARGSWLVLPDLV